MSLTPSLSSSALSSFDYAVNGTYLQQQAQPQPQAAHHAVLKEMDRTLEEVYEALVRQKEVLLYGDHETGCVLTLCFLLKYYNGGGGGGGDTTTLDTTTACRFLQWKSGLNMDLRTNLPLVESYRGYLHTF